MIRTNRSPIRWRGCSKRRAGPKRKLAYMGHVLTENRNGLVVDVRLTQATGTAERDAAAGDAETASRPRRRRRWARTGATTRQAL